jgi:hypothetical protein
MFGSSGHSKQPKSIIDGFTRREKYSKSFDHLHRPEIIEVKSIVRGKSLKKLDIHVHHTNEVCKVNVPNKSPTISFAFKIVNEKMLETSYLHLNHYRIQSWEFFKNVKMKRKSASVKSSDKYLNKHYFKLQDINDMVDTELKRKTKKRL